MKYDTERQSSWVEIDEARSWHRTHYNKVMLIIYDQHCHRLSMGAETIRNSSRKVEMFDLRRHIYLSTSTLVVKRHLSGTHG